MSSIISTSFQLFKYKQFSCVQMYIFLFCNFFHSFVQVYNNIFTVNRDSKEYEQIIIKLDFDFKICLLFSEHDVLKYNSPLLMWPPAGILKWSTLLSNQNNNKTHTDVTSISLMYIYVYVRKLNNLMNIKIDFEYWDTVYNTIK